MIDYNRMGNILKVKIDNFSKKITKELNKVKQNFVQDMLYGIIKSSSCNLAEIARKLEESITLRASEKRLSRNLNNFIGDNEEYSSFKEETNKLLFENYTDIVKNKITNDTIFAFDPGDITKKYASKLESLCDVKDGSTNEIRPGYWMTEVCALTKREKLPIPVYTRMYSTKEKEFLSSNDENIKAVKYLVETYGTIGTYAFDRGFDDTQFILTLLELEIHFVLRMTTKRNVGNKDGNVVESIVKKANRVKMKQSYKYVDKKGITRTAHVGYTKVTIPKIKDKVFYLVVIKSDEFKDTPMMLLTNIKPTGEDFTKIINKVYIRRWKIEEYFRFKKQQFSFEKELVRSLNSIRTLNVLLTIVVGFIAMFSDRQDTKEYSQVFEAAQSLRSNEEIVLVYYAVERGFKEILSKVKATLRKKRGKKDWYISGQMSLL